MESTAQSVPVSKASLWTGRAISGLVVLFMVFDGVTKVTKSQQVARSGAAERPSYLARQGA